MKSATQRSKVRNHLLSGASLTPKQARRLWGCDRLAARVGELREEGLDIVDERATFKVRYSVYRLRPGGGQELFPRVLKGRP